MRRVTNDLMTEDMVVELKRFELIQKIRRLHSKKFKYKGKMVEIRGVDKLPERIDLIVRFVGHEPDNFMLNFRIELKEEVESKIQRMIDENSSTPIGQKTKRGFTKD